MRILVILFFLLVLTGCPHKSYVLSIGKGGNAHVESSVMQQELINGTVTGPTVYCSVPEDAKINPCPVIDKENLP